MKNQLTLWIIIISLLISACSAAPKQDKKEAAQPATSEPQVLSPTNTSTLQPTDSTPTTEPPPSPAEIKQSIQETSPSELPVVTAGESNVNIRSGPGTDYGIMGKLPAGQSLEIIGRNTDSSWWQVPTTNGLGWVAAHVTTASNVDNSIPIAETSPPPPTLTPIPTQAPMPTQTPTAAPTPTVVIVTPPPSTSGYTGPYDPSGPDRDCGDFSNWSDAQSFYEAAGGPASDRHDLDRDRDGIACETLR